MGDSPPKPPNLPELLATAGPGLAAVVDLLTQEASERHEDALQLEQARVELARERAKLARREAELRRKEEALQRKEAELGRKEAGLERERNAARTPTRRGRFERDTTPAPPVELPIYDLALNGNWRLIVPDRITYRWCVAFTTAPPYVRAQVSLARQSQYHRIARIPFFLGDKLDKAGVAFHAIRFVAYADTLVEMGERAEKLLNGERAPRRKPQDPEAPPPLKRGRGRPALVRVKPGAEAKRKDKSRDDGRPKAVRGDFKRAFQRQKPPEPVDPEQVLELAALFAFKNIMSGKYDPENATAEDIADEESVIQRAERILGAIARGDLKPGKLR